MLKVSQVISPALIYQTHTHKPSLSALSVFLFFQKVILENNRVAPEVNLTTIAKRLEGYTGSDIREVCREAVVRIAHEESKKLDEVSKQVSWQIDHHHLPITGPCSATT